MTYELCVNPTPECRDDVAARTFTCDATSVQQALQRWREANAGGASAGAYVTAVRAK